MDESSPTKSGDVAGKTTGAAPASTYKSWKKKYRKMRIGFDRNMQDGEDLHKQEAKAAAIVKRLAVENE